MFVISVHVVQSTQTTPGISSSSGYPITSKEFEQFSMLVKVFSINSGMETIVISPSKSAPPDLQSTIFTILLGSGVKSQIGPQ